jgi:hypothetical protein
MNQMNVLNQVNLVSNHQPISLCSYFENFRMWLWKDKRLNGGLTWFGTIFAHRVRGFLVYSESHHSDRSTR